jgi:hypothetical protein
MVIECKHVWDHISGYFDGTLPAEVLEQVQTHLEHCEICSAILDSTRNILILTATSACLNCRSALAIVSMRGSRQRSGPLRLHRPLAKKKMLWKRRQVSRNPMNHRVSDPLRGH